MRKTMSLRNFVESFIAHNTVVNLYVGKKTERWIEREKIWVGMDWQIVQGPGDEDYFKAHPDVEKCPYADNNVVQVLGAFEDEINTIDNVNLMICVEDV